MAERIVRTCDNCDKEVGHAWIEVSADGDNLCTVKDMIGLGVPLDQDKLILCSSKCVEEFFGGE